VNGILEGEQPPDEFIRWMSHAGITTRSVEDTALVLDVLAERRGQTDAAPFRAALTRERPLRIGIADNFRADTEVTDAFDAAVVAIGRLGYAVSRAAAPLPDLSKGIGNINRDRDSIAARAFKDIDVLLLPTVPTTTPLVKDALNPQALSPELTMFANYYGLPAVSVPCGFDSHGLPIGLQMVAGPGDEAAVLRLAHQYQEHQGDRFYLATEPRP
jgi:aspartyl-tRNA(Asn)/glutamyl-tRNA(Gln) amidotransferase subunit A